MAVPGEPFVTTSLQGVVPVLTLTGDFDIASLYMFRDPLFEALETGNRVILDLSETTFVDSTVLGLMVEGSKRATEAGGSLRIVSPRPNVHRVLILMALDTLIPIHRSLEEAAASADENEDATV